MSTSSISYKQATQVAAFAIAVAIVPPVGVASAIGTIALGVIGYFGIEMADKIKEECKAAFDSRLHRIVPLQRFSLKNREEELRKAVERFRKEKSHDLYLWPAEILSLEQECTLFQKSLNEGCCHGAVSTLFDGIEKKRLSIEQSASAIAVEDVFFRQLAQVLMIRMQTLEKETNLQIQTIQCLKCFPSDALPKSLEELLKTSDETLIILKEHMQRYADEKTHLKEIDPLLSPSFSSREFPPELPCHSYQCILEKTIQCFPPMTNSPIRGTISIPRQHVMAFQYGPEGYYIYDSCSPLTGGLLKYSDKNSFFKKLRALVLDAIIVSRSKNQKIMASFHIRNTDTNTKT
jgi:hypothetical protein